MGVFMFVIILVLIVVLGDVVAKVGVPFGQKLAELMGEMAQDRRDRREGGAVAELPDGALDDLEARLARIEERLDFIEALRAPDTRPALRSGDD